MQIPSIIQKNIPLAPYTTLGVGGAAEFFCVVTTETILMEAIIWARSQSLRVTVLGGGSNVLINDGLISGLVLKMELKGIEFSEPNADGVQVRVAAGEVWDDFVARLAEKNLWGIENLSGIPGSVGAVPVQNVNAYGVSSGDFITFVEGLNILTNEKKTFDHEACAFTYRDSVFKSAAGKNICITHVTFVLHTDAHVAAGYKSASQSIEKKLLEKNISVPSVLDVRTVVLEVRKNIGMLPGMYQSAGSFFKNTILTNTEFDRVREVVEREHAELSTLAMPWYWALSGENTKVSTAFLMECTEYNKTAFADKTFRNTVSISPRHTLSLITVGNATADDMHAFVQKISDAVYEKFSVHIEPEVCFIQ